MAIDISGKNIKIHNILVENANIGVASKSSSKSLINKAIIKKVETCLSSYNKKQEFFGSNLIVKNIDCKNFGKFAQKEYQYVPKAPNRLFYMDDYQVIFP